MTLATIALAALAAGTLPGSLRLEETDTGVRMRRGGSVVWNLEIDNPENRPFFHPLTLPSGKQLTDLRPKDHIWHLGYWFSILRRYTPRRWR